MALALALTLALAFTAPQVADTAAFLDAVGYGIGKKVGSHPNPSPSPSPTHSHPHPHCPPNREQVASRVGRLLPGPGQGPGVPVLCLYSTGVKTPLSFYYTGADWAKDPATTFGDGDGGCIVSLSKPDTNPHTYPDSGPGPARLHPAPTLPDQVQ